MEERSNQEDDGAETGEFGMARTPGEAVRRYRWRRTGRSLGSEQDGRDGQDLQRNDTLRRIVFPRRGGLGAAEHRPIMMLFQRCHRSVGAGRVPAVSVCIGVPVWMTVFNRRGHHMHVESAALAAMKKGATSRTDLEQQRGEAGEQQQRA